MAFVLSERPTFGFMAGMNMVRNITEMEKHSRVHFNGTSFIWLVRPRRELSFVIMKDVFDAHTSEYMLLGSLYRPLEF